LEKKELKNPLCLNPPSPLKGEEKEEKRRWKEEKNPPTFPPLKKRER